MTLANATEVVRHRADPPGRPAPLILAAHGAAPPARAPWVPRTTADRAKLAEAQRTAAALGRRVFGAWHVDPTPRTASLALGHVLSRLAEHGDTVLDFWLGNGNHVAPPSSNGLRHIAYGVGPDGHVDLAAAEDLAREFRPSVILCGSSAHPRRFDFARLRRIADEHEALLVADISAMTALVAAQVHTNPVDIAHVTVAATDEHLGGGDGAMILSGRDASVPFGGNGRTLSQRLGKLVYTSPPDSADLDELTAKAGALAMAGSDRFHRIAKHMIRHARTVATRLRAEGHDLVSGGTDTHLVLLDLTSRGFTGTAAARVLATAGISVTPHRVPADPAVEEAAGGLLVSTASLTQHGCDATGFDACARLLDDALTALRPDGRGGCLADEPVLNPIRRRATALALRYAPQF
ncbi:hypothetical protein AB0K15_37955 [Amycolatopsis sp. NPDC049253]|uniref:hypothetical protein n=1 Tax=Amycolatopsis sp. NPDC049253 TaxID=3155274 RepID=UPI0034459201